MANFVETDSPLPTPKLGRKFSGSYASDSEKHADTRSTPTFVRKCCVRRKANAHAEGGVPAGGHSGARVKRAAKRLSEPDVVGTSYRAVSGSPRHSPRSSRHDAAAASKTKIPMPTRHIPSQGPGSLSTDGTNSSAGAGHSGGTSSSAQHHGAPAKATHNVAQEISSWRNASPLSSRKLPKPKDEIPKTNSEYKASNTGHRRQSSGRPGQDLLTGKQYTKRTGESSEDSEDDGRENVVGISYRKYDISDNCWRFVESRSGAVEAPRGKAKCDISRQDHLGVETESGVERQASDGRAGRTQQEVETQHFNVQLIRDIWKQRDMQPPSGRSLARGIIVGRQNSGAEEMRTSGTLPASPPGISPTCPSRALPTCPSGRPPASPSGTLPAVPFETKPQRLGDETKTLSTFTVDTSLRGSPVLKRQGHRSSERKIPGTPERSVGILRRGSLPARFSGRWAAFQDMNTCTMMSHPEGVSEALNSVEYENEKHTTCRERHWSHDKALLKLRTHDWKTNSEGNHGHSRLAGTSGMKELHLTLAGSQDLNRSREAHHSGLPSRLNLDRNDWKRKSGRFSFDNLVNICSQTVAKSIRQCIAESPDGVPFNVKDLGLERGAAIFGGIVKDFVASLPSDVSKSEEEEAATPGSGGADVEETTGDFRSLGEATDIFQVIREAAQKICERSESIQSAGTVSQNVTSGSPIPESMDESEAAGDLSAKAEDEGCGIPWPRFTSMEEPKMLSRRSSVDASESSRVRLSKTGKIEVIDASVVDDDSGPVDEEGQDDGLSDGGSVCSASQRDDISSAPSSRRSSFTERFNLWRLSWNLKNDSQPPSRSESLKARLQQRRASGSDFTLSYDSKRNTFSGACNDLCSSGQSNKRSSTVETPRLRRRNCPEQQQPPAFTRRGSASSLTLFRSPSETASLARRHSIDERCRTLTKMEKSSVEKASDAFSYFFDYPVLQQGEFFFFFLIITV